MTSNCLTARTLLQCIRLCSAILWRGLNPPSRSNMVIRQGPRKQVRRLGIAGPWRHLQAAQETDHLGEGIAKLRDDKRAFGTAANQAQRKDAHFRSAPEGIRPGPPSGSTSPGRSTIGDRYRACLVLESRNQLNDRSPRSAPDRHGSSIDWGTARRSTAEPARSAYLGRSPGARPANLSMCEHCERCFGRRWREALYTGPAHRHRFRSKRAPRHLAPRSASHDRNRSPRKATRQTETGASLPTDEARYPAAGYPGGEWVQQPKV
jgi:hypothetical protein